MSCVVSRLSTRPGRAATGTARPATNLVGLGLFGSAGANQPGKAVQRLTEAFGELSKFVDAFVGDGVHQSGSPDATITFSGAEEAALGKHRDPSIRSRLRHIAVLGELFHAGIALRRSL